MIGSEINGLGTRMFKVNIEVIKTIEDTYWNDSLYYHLPLMEKIEYYLLEIIKDNEKE